MKNLNVNMNDFYSEKSALVNVKLEDKKTHLSILTDDEKVLVFEDIPFNSPSWCFYVEDNIEDYYNTIKNVDWIKSNLTSFEKETIEDLLEGELN